MAEGVPRFTPPASHGRVGAEVRRVRRERGLTQQEVADRLHFSRELVAKIETGRQHPSERFVQRFEQAFGPDPALRAAFAAAESGWIRAPGRGAARVAPIDWLQRFQQYYRIYRAIAAFEGELIEALRHRKAQPETSHEHLSNALYHYANFRLELHHYEREQGALWILSDADDEQNMREAIGRLRFLTPFSERDLSWLRSTLREAEDLELEPFISLVEASERGGELMTKLTQWIERCEYPVDDLVAKRCAVHDFLLNSNVYMATVEGDWYRIADWYRYLPLHYAFAYPNEEPLSSEEELNE